MSEDWVDANKLLMKALYESTMYSSKREPSREFDRAFASRVGVAAMLKQRGVEDVGHGVPDAPSYLNGKPFKVKETELGAEFCALLALMDGERVLLVMDDGEVVWI